MLSVSSTEFSFSERTRYFLEAWTFHAGDCVYLQGPNGSGKSTYLKIFLQNLECDYAYVAPSPPHEPSLRLESFWSLLQSNVRPYDSSLERNLRYGDLSQGNQKLFLLQALLDPKAPVWVIDEGWVHLDISSLEVVAQFIRMYCHQGGRVLYTDHEERITIDPTQVLSITCIESEKN